MPGVAAAVTDAVLVATGLRKSFGDVRAVDDLSLAVRRGEVFGFLGPNGAGKTTTVNMLCGLLRPDAGVITFDAHDAGSRSGPARRAVGYCPQDLVVWDDLTCLEQLVFVGQMYDLDGRAARAKALRLLETFGLADRRRMLAKALSGGMKRRLNVALALVHDPALVILDEPQAGLDPQSRILVREYIRSLAGRVTVIVTTHDMDEADRMADRIAIIDRGRLLVEDTPEHLKRRVGPGDVVELRLPGVSAERAEPLLAGLPAGLRSLGCERGVLRLAGPDVLAALPAVLERSRAGGMPVEDVVIRRTTLEDVFIDLTGRGLRE